MKKKIVETEPVELPQEIWNVPKVCNFLGVGRTRLYQMLKEGLPSLKIGNKRLFDPRDIAHWWKRQKELA